MDFFDNPDLPTVAPKIDLDIGVPKNTKIPALTLRKTSIFIEPEHTYSWKMILSGFGKSYFLGGENVNCSAGKVLNSHPF